MKVIATLILSVALCGVVAAAPMSLDSSETNAVVAADVLGGSETGNLHSAELCPEPGNGGGGPIEVIPEPASMALLGIGLGLAALRRRKI
ncbi:MAG TPA: PEP-CTERM sorting domain-containing protein [Planctomycetota bacterium]|nr:PEP-CTERM sorting domain-containing protein [Planctomycetota bacterium]